MFSHIAADKEKNYLYVYDFTLNINFYKIVSCTFHIRIQGSLLIIFLLDFFNLLCFLDWFVDQQLRMGAPTSRFRSDTLLRKALCCVVMQWVLSLRNTKSNIAVPWALQYPSLSISLSLLLCFVSCQVYTSKIGKCNRPSPSEISCFFTGPPVLTQFVQQQRS